MIEPLVSDYELFNDREIEFQCEYEGFELADELESWKVLQKQILHERGQLVDRIEDLQDDLRDLEDEEYELTNLLEKVVSDRISKLKVRLGHAPCDGQLALFGGES